MLLQCVGLASPQSPDKPPIPFLTRGNVTNATIPSATTLTVTASDHCLDSANSSFSDAISTASSSTSSTSSTSGIDSACSSLDGFSSLDSNADNETSVIAKSSENWLEIKNSPIEETKSISNCINQLPKHLPSQSPEETNTEECPPTTRAVNQGPWLVRPRTHRASTFSGFLPSRSSCPRIDENSNPE